LHPNSPVKEKRKKKIKRDLKAKTQIKVNVKVKAYGLEKHFINKNHKQKYQN